MVYDVLKELPKIEDKTSEFKIFLNESDDQAINWLKTVDAFANTIGGKLYIGIEDKTGEPIGLNKAAVDKTILSFSRLVKSHIVPLPQYEVMTLPFIKGGEEVYIVVFTIEKSEAIHFLKYKGFSSVFVREFGLNSLAGPEKMAALYASRAAQPYDAIPTKRRFSPADFQTLYRRYQETQHQPLTENALADIDFFDRDGYLTKGAVLFADDYQGGETLTLVTRFPGISKGSSAFTAAPEYKGNIISNIENVLAFLNDNNYSSELKLDSSRSTVLSYPTRSLFEAVVNAYAHKNYYIDSPIVINLFYDRLEIESPGSFYVFDSLVKETNIASIRPSRRNKLITEVLTMCRYMERRGTGFGKIAQDYAGVAENKKPYLDANGAMVRLTLPNLIRGVVDDKHFNIDLKLADGKPLPEREREILSFCYPLPRSITDIASHLHLTVSSYLRNQILGHLVERRLLFLDTTGKADLYSTNRMAVQLI